MAYLNSTLGTKSVWHTTSERLLSPDLPGLLFHLYLEALTTPKHWNQDGGKGLGDLMCWVFLPATFHLELFAEGKFNSMELECFRLSAGRFCSWLGGFFI